MLSDKHPFRSPSIHLETTTSACLYTTKWREWRGQTGNIQGNLSVSFHTFQMVHDIRCVHTWGLPFSSADGWILVKSFSTDIKYFGIWKSMIFVYPFKWIYVVYQFLYKLCVSRISKTDCYEAHLFSQFGRLCAYTIKERPIKTYSCSLWENCIIHWKTSMRKLHHKDYMLLWPMADKFQHNTMALLS